MKGQLPAVAAGALLALAVAIAALWVTAPSPTRQGRTDALAAELRCPDCQGLSVADSETAAAREIRRQVDELVLSGATDDEVRAHFVARYGEWILLGPRLPVVWLLPLFVVLAGVAALVAWLRGRAPAAPTPVPDVSDAARRRVRDEAEALDA
jgi:cytochrome c-type biogenesis protein CcmH/NrfF